MDTFQEWGYEDLYDHFGLGFPGYQGAETTRIALRAMMANREGGRQDPPPPPVPETLARQLAGVGLDGVEVG